MKWLGVLIVIGTTTWLGFDISSKYRRRVVEIRQFILSLQMLENEMLYSHLPLREIFKNISVKLVAPTNIFYGNLAKEMDDAVADFNQIWKEKLTAYRQFSTLKSEEIDIINQFGNTLGQHTAVQQQKHIVLAIKYLENELTEAIENRIKYEKMFKSIGVLFGIFIVLLLI